MPKVIRISSLLTCLAPAHARSPNPNRKTPRPSKTPLGAFPVVRLAQYGNDRLISRSQPKRVLSRVELFKTVVFNFEEVPTIGQAFADEIFRVFANTHPQIELVAIRANSEVKRIARRQRPCLLRKRKRSIYQEWNPKKAFL